MKKYEEFVEKLAEELRKKGEEWNFTIELLKVNKANLGTQHAISIKKAPTQVAISYYPRKEYEEYKKGRTLKELALEIMLEYKSSDYLRKAIELESDFNENFLENENIEIKCKVLNKDKNIHMLKEIVHYEFLDFIVVFYVTIAEDFTVTITNQYLKNYGMKIENLKKKVKKQEYILQSMSQVLCEIVGVENEVEEDFMYILTNKEKYCGASAILEKEYFVKAWEIFQENFYILPSTIHELILLPESMAPTVEEIKEMVTNVNNEIWEKDFLSNNVYYFNGEEIVFA